MTKRAQTNGTLNTSKIDPKTTLKTTPAAEDGPKAAPEGAKKRPQNRPKQPLRSLQNPLHPMARKRRPAPPVLTRPPGAQTLRFPLFFHFRSTLRDPRFWGLLEQFWGQIWCPFICIHTRTTHTRALRARELRFVANLRQGVFAPRHVVGCYVF